MILDVYIFIETYIQRLDICNIMKLYNKSLDKSYPIGTILYHYLSQTWLFLNDLLLDLLNFFAQLLSENYT